MIWGNTHLSVRILIVIKLKKIMHRDHKDVALCRLIRKEGKRKDIRKGRKMEGRREEEGREDGGRRRGRGRIKEEKGGSKGRK